MNAAKTDNLDIYGLLLDIFERLGRVEERLTNLERSFQQHREEVEAFAPVAATVKRIEPIADDYQQQKWTARGIWFVIGGGGATTLLHFSDGLKALILRQ